MVKELSIESIKKDIIDKLLNDLDILNHFKKYTEKRYNVPISKFLNLFIFDCDASNVGEDYISVEVAEYEMNRLINSDCKRYIVSIKMSLKMESDICKMATTISNIVNYKLKNAYEVFIRVDNTENYWISNYGRTVNNLNHKDKKTFYEHKQGKCHITVFEIERYSVKNKKGQLTGEIAENRYRRETSPEELVAETFLVRYTGRKKIWHKDGDENNNWYKNLLYVSEKDYKDLKAGKVTWQELNLEQEYIEYRNKASLHAYKIYNGILKRCGDTADDDSVRSCYDKSKMCQLWLDNPKEFVRWYLEHYYECDGEEMDVEKDLFGDGSGLYCPEFCCIAPKGLNTLLANAKKHYKDGETPDNTLPLESDIMVKLINIMQRFSLPAQKKS